MESSTVQRYSLAQQYGLAERVQHEIDNPLKLLVALNKIGNTVQVNNEFTVFNNFQELEKFLFDRKVTIHTLSFFSNLNTTPYNKVFTNFKEYNLRIISIQQKIQFLTHKISQETNPYIRNLLIIDCDMLKEQLNQIRGYFNSNKLDTWVCRHMAFAYIFDLFGSNFQEANNFFCSDNLKYIHKQIDIEINKMVAANLAITAQLFAENLTIENLIACENYLNSKNIFCLDDHINNILSNIENYSINTKLSDIGLHFKKIFESSLREGKTDSEAAEIDHAIKLIDYFCKSLLPTCNHSFHTDMLRYDLSFHSINSFNQYLQQQCCRLYYKCPLNYQEKYILTTKNHMMSFKIVHQVDAVEIFFFDINYSLKEKVFRITHGEYHKEINILNFLATETLIEYGVLECDDDNLATMVCYRVNNFEGDL